MEKEEFAVMKDIMMLTNLIMIMDDGYLRKKLVEFMKVETVKTGNILLQKALDEGKITEKEITRLGKVYGAKRDEISEIFKLYYDTGVEIDDGNKERKHIMVTIKGSGIWNMREYIKEKYGLIVLNQDEAIEFMRDIEFNRKYGLKSKFL